MVKLPTFACQGVSHNMWQNVIEITKTETFYSITIRVVYPDWAWNMV